MLKSENKMIGGVLLVAGTTIGAGMLALPVFTGFAGLIPTIALLLAYWAYMTYTAFLLLEVNLWMGENINLVTMASITLGKAGKVISWTAYLLLLYLLTTAYLSGGGLIISTFLNSLLGTSFPEWSGVIPLLLIFGFVVYEGTKYVDYFNRILMLGLVLSYGLIMVFLIPHIEPSYLQHKDWGSIFIAISLLATSFGFHIIIPTLTTYMHRDVPNLKKALFFGSLIPLGVYILWEVFTLGVIPLETIKAGYVAGDNGVKLINDSIDSNSVDIVAQAFSIFAIITSFLGVTLSLTDFLADGFHIKKTYKGKSILLTLTFVPPLLFMAINPRAFLLALQYAGVYGVIILLGLMPPIMVWSGRYRKGFESTFKTPGGKIALVAAIAFSLLIIALEIGNTIIGLL